MNLAIACVFTPSRTYTADYVKVFSNVFARYHPECHQICLTNYKRDALPERVESINLQYSFTKKNGWFGKLELFRPDIEYDILYLDLDNIITGPLTEIFKLHEKDPEKPYMIEDVAPTKTRLQSAVMYIPHSKKHLVWDPFIENPWGHIKEAGKLGDAHIIRKFWKNHCGVYQKDLSPNYITSYRFQARQRTTESKVVCMHGAREKPLYPKFRKNPLIINHVRKYLK